MVARKRKTTIDTRDTPAGYARVNGKLVPLVSTLVPIGGSMGAAQGSTAAGEIERLTRYPGGIVIVFTDAERRRHHALAISGKMTELGYHERSGHCFECKSRECVGARYAVERLDTEGYVDAPRMSTQVFVAQHGNIKRPERRGYRR